MTTGAAATTVRIRVPLISRILAGVVLVGGLAVLGSNLVRAIHRGHPMPVLFVVAFALLWVAIGWRTASLAVIGRADGRLVVRNQIRTRTLARSEIEDVRRSAGGPFSPTQGALQLLLTDGSVLMLQATVTPPFAGRRSQQQLEELKSWLAATF